MAKYVKHIPPIEKIVAPNGPIIRVLRSSQLLYVKQQNYGVRKLHTRLNQSK